VVAWCLWWWQVWAVKAVVVRDCDARIACETRYRETEESTRAYVDEMRGSQEKLSPTSADLATILLEWEEV
jgi:hypothetical protein